ncbi:MAG: ABC transporter ATP-binding protein [Eubacteriales bacterium]|nr:ABC transporter ATP-binding protein [Eubacteriales bacterium]MDD3073021.1 ABC transporter ATP-binding protein [Eubacteriales bacterium]MDD4078438.1 ABC transporter ATP-binding protein [Eubacteriales bacterium]MDD4768473.1 ABC transporter ATP-binding protein [Eubacteriales bacterium]
MIRVSNLTKYYGKFAAVQGISFAVERGNIYGFVGPNGAGKTTTLRMLATLLAPTSGEITIGGVQAFVNPLHTRKLIGYMPDFFGVYNDLKVDEYLEFYGEASGRTLGDLRRDIPSLLELVGLSDKRQSYVNNLSRGMKQRLCLARALVHRPEVLLLDEPASGLDPRARVELRNILKELQNMGKTIIISSHILAELSQLCTHVGIINNGLLALSAPVSEVLARVEGDSLLSIAVADRLEEAKLWLLEQQGVRDVALVNTGGLEAVFSGDRLAQAGLLREMAARFTLFEFTPSRGNLEQIFMEITEVDKDAKAQN